MINRTLPPGTLYSAYRQVDDEIAAAGIAACDELIAALIEVRGDLINGHELSALCASLTLEQPRAELEAALLLIARRDRADHKT